MCGIAGYLNFNEARSSADIQATLGRVNAALAHRGPDDRGIWSDPENFCHLGHTRLSVLDLSAAGHQPMLSRDKRYVISFNGEIYNFKSLRRDLEKAGYRFTTGTDTEVLLAGFEHSGIKVFQHLDGMFAVAIYDRQNGCLTLARDRAGEKPLYYAMGDDCFVFASELRSLLEVRELPVALSEQALALYFTLRYVPEPDSLLDPIRKLEPGMVLQVFRNGRMWRERYYGFSVDQDGEFNADRLDEYGALVEDALVSALTDRLNSDVPLGMFLSSGVDSSLACALLTRKLGRKVKTFTVGFEGDAGSEHGPAREIAQALGTEHHEHIFGTADFERICGDIGRLLDEPNGDRSCVPTFLLSEFTRQHVTVTLSGDAGDELFGGYGRYPAFAAAYDRPQDFQPAAMVQTYIEQGLPVFGAAAVRKALPDGYGAVTDFFDCYAPFFMHLRRPALHGLRQLDFHTYLPGAVLAKVDRMSMRHALEVRTPFLSPQMLKLASKANAAFCMNGGMQKVVLRKLLAKYLPEQHAVAPKKGFGMPASVFLNNQERVRGELLAARQRLAATDFFSGRAEGLEHLAAQAGANINSAWAFIVLAKWIDTVERPL